MQSHSQFNVIVDMQLPKRKNIQTIKYQVMNNDEHILQNLNLFCFVLVTKKCIGIMHQPVFTKIILIKADL